MLVSAEKSTVAAEQIRDRMRVVMLGWRKNAKVSLAKLAALLETSKGFVCDIERGRRIMTNDMARRLIKIMGDTK